MSPQHLDGTSALVTGASRGLGRGMATALSKAGASVVGVARNGPDLHELSAELGGTFTAEVADAADPAAASQLLDRYDPRLLVLNAGAVPTTRPLPEQTWESFSRNWEVDVQQAFHWMREALVRPLAPGSVVIAISSGAALFGSPMSGGYAGAKATVRFIAAYAASESARSGLGVRFVSVLPQLTPATELGAAGVAAYAAREGMSVADFLATRGPALTPEHAGQAVIDLTTDASLDADAYLLTAGGLSPLS
jgi:NAD(P)-dependent dehydrogenase (short-subunit alcohol dehydrogenase family)